MMKRFIVSATVAGMCAGLSIAAQTPAPQGQTSPGGGQTQQPATRPAQPQASAQTGAVTLVGCLYRERDVPGRSPNVAERLGVGEDYIIADARPQGTQAQGLASGRMYKVEQVADDQLQKLVGRRVEVTGRIDADPSDTTPSGAPARDRNPISPDSIELPEFEASSIRSVEGTCPATPAAATGTAPR